MSILVEQVNIIMRIRAQNQCLHSRSSNRHVLIDIVVNNRYMNILVERVHIHHLSLSEVRVVAWASLWLVVGALVGDLEDWGDVTEGLVVDDVGFGALDVQFAGLA